MKRKTLTDTTTAPVLAPCHYVGIGASAGGLEAIESFFSAMPPDSGLAFIVVQHLSPDYKSLMVELLSRKTAMPVHRAEDAMEVLPNHVYLIPPKKNLTIFHGKLLLADQDQDHSRGINLPIDLFLRSLAEDQGEHAVAIILSGTGSDGTRGVRAIKENGGLVMVQSEESAKFDGMPRAAISTGLADFVLPPDQMPSQLQAYTKHPFVVKSERSENLLSNEDGLIRIFALLRERCKVDFTYYKPSTVMRRIERRMTVNHVEDIRDYVTFILNNPSELNTLYRELLIGVTSFFRDQEAFDYLASTILPDLFRSAPTREIRFWIAGCSTGEEAYSLAILARECLDQMGISRDIKIFATDIDRDAIHYAATGSYPESIAADLSPRILTKYFHKRDDNFQIARTIREMVVFAQHNLIKDPPFTKVDLISCRNLLIYFQTILQRKVFEFFNFSLAANGVLFLGSSETTGEMASYFDVLEARLKIFRSKGRLKPLSDTHLLAVTDTRFHEMKGKFANSRRSLRATDEERVLERFIEAASPDYIPLSLVVNEQLEVQHVLGDASGYFKLPSGKVVNDISKMAVKELAIPLATGIQKVFRQGHELRFSNIRISHPEGNRLIDLRIKPLPTKKEQEQLVAVFVSETKKNNATDLTQPVQTYDLSKEAEDRMRDLEHELQFTRENLQATIEELETSNEELQATNEELLASNEELQSTNEELQSTNEELFTVNAEYQSKIMELTELHNDMDNLLSATQIGSLLLDENMEVRRFSKRISDIFKLLDSDIGRPITHITHHLLNCDPLTLIRDVQSTGKAVEQEVQTQDASWHLMRIVPYAIGPKAFSGTVLTFIEISLLKQAQEKAKEMQQLFADVIHASPDLVWLSDTAMACTWFNGPWLKFTGSSLEQEQSNGWTKGVHPDDLERCLKTCTEAFSLRQPFPLSFRLRRHDGVYRLLMGEGRPRFKPDGSFSGYVCSCLDITEKTCPLEQKNCLMRSGLTGEHV
jgi:two-component system, chemotaxis family, CheB/CheR fusion protein